MKVPKKSGAQRARSANNAAQSAPKSTDAEARKLIETIAQQAQEIENLKWKLKKKSDHLQTIEKMVFGRSSEKTRKVTKRGISAKTKAKQKSNATKKNTKGGEETRNRAFSSSLRREMRIVEPDPKQFCPCGCGHRTFKTDIRSRLHYKPAEYYVVESHYPKYVCPACNKLVQAKSPKRLLGQSPFGEDVIAQIVVAKFSDFLPYYRLENITERAGHRISRQTMHKRMEELSDKLLWLNLALRKDIKGSSVLCMDETTIPVIQRGRGQVKRCYGWAVKRDHTRWCGNEPPAIVYVFKESRAGYNAVEILEGFSGHLHVDGYAGYNPLTEEDRPEGPVGLIYCWTHVRRRFERVIEKDGSRAAEAIKEMIDSLNNIENKFIGKTHTARLEARTRKSKPIVDRIFRKCESLVGNPPLFNGAFW